MLRMGRHAGRPSARIVLLLADREGETNFCCFAFGNRYVLGLRAQHFMPGFDHVVSRWKRINVECATISTHRVVRMIEYSDIGVHPAMHVTLKGHHHLDFGKFSFKRHTLDRLTGVEFLIRHGCGVNIVQCWIAV